MNQLPGAEVQQRQTVVLNSWGREEFTGENINGRRCCHELHRVASAAVDAVQGDAFGAGSVPTPTVTGQVGLLPQPPLHKANAWLNVNRANDTNIMHVHTTNKYALPAPASAQASAQAPHPHPHKQPHKHPHPHRRHINSSLPTRGLRLPHQAASSRPLLYCTDLYLYLT